MSGLGSSCLPDGPQLKELIPTMVTILLSAVCLILVKAQTLEQVLDNSEAVKMAEGYVLAADFDNVPVAQLPYTKESTNQSDSYTNIAHPAADNPASRIVNDPGSKPPSSYDHITTSLQAQPNDWSYIPPSGHSHMSAADRDIINPPVTIAQRSLLAVGFITFLLLLNSLQNNIMNMVLMQAPPAVASNSLLGGVTQALGRR